MKPQKNPLEYSPYQVLELTHWKKYLASRTPDLQVTLRRIIEGIKDKTLLKNQQANIAEIEFYHGVDELDFWLKIIDENHKLIEHEFGEEHIFKFYSPKIKYPSLDYKFVYPEDIDVYYEDERYYRMLTEKHLEFFFWFSKNWMECEGHHIGYLTRTLENSIIRVFNLNKLIWGDNNHPIQNTYPYPLKRNLTDYELRRRIGLEDNQNHHTKWRYFEKENEFIEFGYFSFEYYTRTGLKTTFENTPYEKIKFAKNEFTEKIDGLLNAGFEEKRRPSLTPLVSPTIHDWKIWCYPQESIIPIDEIEKLEKFLNIKLPKTYRKFITTNTLQNFEKNKPHFPIALENWREIEKYFLPSEIIDHFITIGRKFDGNLPIAKTTTHEMLMLRTVDASVYIFSKNDCTQINTSFMEFLEGCIKFSGYFCSLGVHTSKRNIESVKNWFEKGGQLSAIKSAPNMLQEATANHEMMEVLLKNGVNPNLVRYIFPNQIQPQTLTLMIQHGLDFKELLKKHESLRTGFNKRPEFADLMSIYYEED